MNQVVRFKRSMSPYNTGDIAGFPAHVAQVLIGNGYAEPTEGSDYTGMGWFKLRAIVKQQYGVEPKDKKEALALMRQHSLEPPIN